MFSFVPRGCSIALIVFLFGCNSAPKRRTVDLESKMNARIGQNLDQVVGEIGPPTSYFPKPDGDVVYTWRSQVRVPFGGHSPCDVSYTVGPDAIIKTAEHSGNGC